MTTTYERFDSTMANIVSDLAAKIDAHPDWANVTPSTPVNSTFSVATTNNVSTATFASVTGFQTGDVIVIAPGTASQIYRQISTIVGNVVTWVGGSTGVVFAIGTVVQVASLVLKTTTTRGAQMVINLIGAIPALNRFGFDVWQSYSGSTGVNRVTRYLHWRASASGSLGTDPVHAILSLSADHLYVEIEGPRATETNPTNTTWGSIRSYLAISDMVPYQAEAAPVVVVMGASLDSVNGATNSQSHTVDISKNYQGGSAWETGRLGTLSFPTTRTSDTITLERSCAIDGKEYMWPYVVFSATDGIRGRLARFFNCNTTAPSAPQDLGDSPGSDITYGATVYRTRAVNKGDGSATPWASFGTSGSNTALMSVVVAVPYSGA